MKRPILVLIVAIAAVLLAVLLLRPSQQGEQPVPGPQTPPPPLADNGVGADGATPPTPGSTSGPSRASHTPAPAASNPPATETERSTEPAEPNDADQAIAPAEEPEPTVWPASGEGIQGAMGEALPRIRRCYEQALELEPDMAGKIVVAFTIGTTDTASGVGQVLDAGIADATIEQTTMDDCLLDAMEGLQFDPPADGELEVNYPFHFSVE